LGAIKIDVYSLNRVAFPVGDLGQCRCNGSLAGKKAAVCEAIPRHLKRLDLF
jgi:hypothetical protein